MGFLWSRNPSRPPRPRLQASSPRRGPIDLVRGGGERPRLERGLRVECQLLDGLSFAARQMSREPFPRTADASSLLSPTKGVVKVPLSKEGWQ